MGLDRAPLQDEDTRLDPELLRRLGVHAMDYALRHRLGDHERTDLLAMIGLINAAAD